MSKAGSQKGESVSQPHHFSRGSWREVARRVWRAIEEDQLTLVAAALAFYGLLSLFPALTAMVAVYGLALDPTDIWAQSEKLAALLPEDVHRLVVGQLSDLVEKDEFGLSLGLVVSLTLLMWSASTGIHNLMKAINLAYNEEETRSFLELRLIALGLTLVIQLFSAIAVALIAVIPQVLRFLGFAEEGQWLVAVARWPLLAAGIVLVLSVLYRFGPDRSDARWQWVSWGAAVAAVTWLAGSWLFSWYVESFGRFHETYGALGAVVVLMLWLFLSSFVILLGAELNSALELQTLEDSTTGPEQPMGERGAWVADNPPGGEDCPPRRDGGSARLLEAKEKRPPRFFFEGFSPRRRTGGGGAAKAPRSDDENP